MFDVIVNWGAVLGVSVVAFIIGWLWYGPIFGKQWLKLSKISATDIAKAKKKGMVMPMILNFIGTFIMFFVLANLLALVGAVNVGQGIVLAFWVWLGFLACTTLLGSVLWEGKGWALFALNGLYWLVQLIIGSILLIIWI